MTMEEAIALVKAHDEAAMLYTDAVNSPRRGVKTAMARLTRINRKLLAELTSEKPTVGQSVEAIFG